MTCTCRCTCPLEAGDQIRSTHVTEYTTGPVRTNEKCPQWIAYISDAWVVYRTYVHYAEGLRYLNEKVVSRREFNVDYERDPRRQPEPTNAPPRHPAQAAVSDDPEW